MSAILLVLLLFSDRPMLKDEITLLNITGFLSVSSVIGRKESPTIPHFHPFSTSCNTLLKELDVYGLGSIPLKP